MTSICIIRHGQTDWNKEDRIQGKSDIALNETGIEQAKKCASLLKEDDWDVLITSPLKRAKKTAEIIHQSLQLPIIEMPAFTERSYGDAEGMTRKEREIAFPERKYPNQEPRVTFNERVMNGLQTIHETYPNEKIILIAHGGVINAILANLSNGELGSGKTRLAHAGMSHIYFRDSLWKIKDYNQVGHLKIWL